MAGDVVFTAVSGMQCWCNRFAAVHDFWTAIRESAAVIIVGGFRDPAGNRV